MQPWHYIALLGAVIAVYAAWLPRTDKKTGTGRHMMKDLEETMERFSAELEDENRELLEAISGMKKQHDSEAAELRSKIMALEEQNRLMAETLQELSRRAAKTEDEAIGRKASGSPDARHEAEAAGDALAETARIESLRNGPENEAAVQPEAGAHGFRERYPELFRLHQQGKSTEYIAKKLNMNKGEVTLILRLAEREETAYA
jgi:uncharacterized protein YdiU (UPF0061 family)